MQLISVCCRLQENKPYQFLRLQLTAGKDDHENETLSYRSSDDPANSDVVVLPQDGNNPTGDLA